MPEPVVLELEMPMPPSRLSPNTRIHWAQKAPVTAALRYEAGVRARAARYQWTDQHGIWKPLKEPVHITVTFVFKTLTRRDFDNFFARCKPIWDGFKDAGVIREDNCWVLGFTILAEHEPMKVSRKPERLKIRLEGAS